MELQDTGCGIDIKHLPNIFDRFYRADSSRNRATGGAGLGLSIAREIVIAHGGTIDVKSTVERGSTFTISIPSKTP
jgi:signal transduction histidine kinase